MLNMIHPKNDTYTWSVYIWYVINMILPSKIIINNNSQKFSFGYSYNNHTICVVMFLWSGFVSGNRSWPTFISLEKKYYVCLSSSEQNSLTCTSSVNETWVLPNSDYTENKLFSWNPVMESTLKSTTLLNKYSPAFHWPSLTGVCWLSPRAPVSTTLYSLAPQVSPETLAETAAETFMETSVHTHEESRLLWDKFTTVIYLFIQI